MIKTSALTAYRAYLEKTAVARYLKYLTKLPKVEQAAAVAALPKGMRNKASYKLLGHQAEKAVKSMPGGAGHGSRHVFNVTRNAQKLTPLADPAVRQHATLGAMLHDVGRGAEGRMKKRLGKEVFNKTPSAFHSELGGRYADQFLRQNKQLVKNVPGLRQGQLKSSIRAHDTDAHGVFPWTKKHLDKNKAADTIYRADKVDGMGQEGVDRTLAMAREYNDSPARLRHVFGKNMNKYQKVVDTTRDPMQRRFIQNKLNEYDTGMSKYLTAVGG